MKTVPKVFAAVLLYLGLALSANAGGLDAAKAARAGDMMKLRFHESPQVIPFVRFQTFEGDPLSLAEYSGKVLLVNFWATWCGPCRKEMPMLAELQDAFGGAQFEVVTIATGRNAPPAMTRFFEQIGVDNLPLHRDPKGNLAQAMGVDALPITVILDAQGREIARMRGDADWASDSAKAVLRALIPSS